LTVVIVTAVPPEADAVTRDVRGSDVVVICGGVGPVAAATTTCRALADDASITHVISAGICGAFEGRAEVGDVVVATASVAADLGCRTDAGFLTLADMGLDQESRADFRDADAWCQRLKSAGVSACAGDVLTLSCMTGTDDEARRLSDRHPHAVAEAMEGWGVAWAGRSFGVKTAEVRAVSNIIGKRDPSQWDIVGAFDALSRAFAALLAEPLP